MKVKGISEDFSTATELALIVEPSVSKEVFDAMTQPLPFDVKVRFGLGGMLMVRPVSLGPADIKNIEDALAAAMNKIQRAKEQQEGHLNRALSDAAKKTGLPLV
jgi:hypothetical protein